MRFFLILSILFSSAISLSQSEFAKNKILLVRENLEKVPPYTCEVKIKIDVSFINIKERIGKMTFLGPNDIDYKLKGFAFLPKKEMGGISSDLFNSDFIAVPVGNENGNIPMIELTHNWDEERLEGGRNFGHLAFQVNNIYETCEKLIEEGIEINRPPRDGRMAFVKSPDGISIELLQNGEALEIIEPWASMENSGTW